jgi:hypothetical protein
MKRLALLAALAGLLAACGGVEIKPDPVIPRALVEPLPTAVGIIIPGDMRNFKQEETRYGSSWKIDLGAGHLHLVEHLFKAAFRDVREFSDLETAKAAPGLKALFEPRIEQYSFATARDTGGRYYAVTVRYRINMYTPTGELADSFTLSGYGSALAKGMSSGKPLEVASIGAMRDAAARFLVQFPSQSAGKTLARNEPIAVQPKGAEGAGNADPAGIEAVPIEETESGSASAAPPATPAPPEQNTKPAAPPEPTTAQPPSPPKISALPLSSRAAAALRAA